MLCKLNMKKLSMIMKLPQKCNVLLSNMYQSKFLLKYACISVLCILTRKIRVLYVIQQMQILFFKIL